MRTFTTRGTLSAPAGVACGGRVLVTVKAGSRTLSTRRVPVTSECTFNSKLTFASARTLRGVSRLSVQVQFLGNAQLKRQTAAVIRVKTQ